MDSAQFGDVRVLARKTSEPAASEDSIPRPRFRWKTRIALPAGMIVGFLGLLAATAYDEIVPSPDVLASPVVVKRADGGVSGAVTVQAAGWIEAEPYKSYVTALSDGVVREVLILEGDPVETGQVVVRLVDDDARLAVQSAEAKVAELLANVDAARAELAAAREEWDNPVERQRAVAVAEAQVAETKATGEQLAAEILQEEANLEHVKTDYDKGVGLHASSSISEVDLIRRRSAYQAQKAKVEATTKRHAAMKELVTRHEAEMIAARDFMRLRTEDRRKLDKALASLAQAEAALLHGRTVLEEARLRKDRMEIRSPMDGVVMSRLTEPGSKVVLTSDNPGSARVMSLYDPLRLQVRVDVPLADAAKIGAGQSVEVTLDVLPDRSFSGTVSRVLHEANIQKNTLEVKVALSNPDPQLKPEMLARVKFLAKAEVRETEDATRVFAPEAAFKLGGANGGAWVVQGFDGSRGRIAAKPVRLGTARKEGWVDVLEGLQPGDLVVTRTPVELKNGKRVRVTGE